MHTLNHAACLVVCATLLAVVRGATAQLSPNEQIVFDHVAQQANLTFRNSTAYLKYPYLVPAGPYNELWDWDSLFMGIALLPFGSAQYLAGSMMNFLDHTDLQTGEVPGAFQATGPYSVLKHAKPIIIQGAWLVAKYMNDTAQFQPFQEAMRAQLKYWQQNRKDPETGLYVWWDQMESGADNLVTSICPSFMSPQCWVNASVSGVSLAGADLMSFLYREYLSYANFLESWAMTADSAEQALLLNEAVAVRSDADDVHKATDAYLWQDDLGYYLAYNTTARSLVTNRVFLMAFPVFGGMASDTQAEAALSAITQSDMYTQWGIRSTSNTDPRYTNENVIVPYSNWRGPVWILPNALLAYGYNSAAKRTDDSILSAKFQSFSEDLGVTLVATLAGDLNATRTWHECYSSDSGSGLAAPGFLSFDTLGAFLITNLKNGINPFEL